MWDADTLRVSQETIQSAFYFTGLLIGIIGTRWHLDDCPKRKEMEQEDINDDA